MPKLNLLYHVYPRPTATLIQNLRRIGQAAPLFNGRCLFTIVEDAGTLPPAMIVERLKPAFAGQNPEFMVVKNYGSEARALFDHLLPQIVSQREDEYTFFAHAKGTSSPKCDNPFVMVWNTLMYDHCLDSCKVLQAMEQYACAGCFKNSVQIPRGEQCDWHYSGTMFWINHARVFSRRWLPPNRDRYAAEAWLGRFIPAVEAHCFFGEGVNALYTLRPYQTIFPGSAGDEHIARLRRTAAILYDECAKELRIWLGLDAHPQSLHS